MTTPKDQLYVGILRSGRYAHVVTNRDRGTSLSITGVGVHEATTYTKFGWIMLARSDKTHQLQNLIGLMPCTETRTVEVSGTLREALVVSPDGKILSATDDEDGQEQS